MPKFLEARLKREYGANSKIPYKVMNSIGAMRGNKETAKGREMEKKHMADMKKAPFHMTHITHHDDGSHSVQHEPHMKAAQGGAFMDRGAATTYSATDGKELFAKLQKHIGSKGAQDEAQQDKEPVTEVEHEEETVA